MDTQEEQGQDTRHQDSTYRDSSPKGAGGVGWGGPLDGSGPRTAEPQRGGGAAHCTGRQWNAVFNCQGNAVRGPDFTALGIMVNQDGQTGTEATDTATVPADQKTHTKPIPGGGH